MKKTLLISLIILILPTVSRALEAGDAYIGLFGGYQDEIFTEDDHLHYFGPHTTLFQPTLNWGDYNLNLISFYRDNHRSQYELGYLGADMKDLWLSPGYKLNGFLGDSSLQFITPSMIFEHLGLPGHSLRGVGTELRTRWGKAGLQAGQLTEGDYLIPGAVKTIGDDLLGAYLEWNGSYKTKLSGAVNILTNDGEDRFLSTLYSTVPLQRGELRTTLWYDSLSEQIAGTTGLRRARQTDYSEVGLLYVPEDFNYLSRSASLPEGETRLFGTYRNSGVQQGYHIEGSWARQVTATDLFWHYQASMGGYYRIFLRNTINGSLHVSHLDADSGNNQVRMQENIRYTIKRPKWDTALQFQALQTNEKRLLYQSHDRTKCLSFTGDISSNYRSGDWDAGGKIRLEHKNTNNKGDKTSILLRAEGRIFLGLGITGGGFFQYSYGWMEDGSSETLGGGTNLTFPLPKGWQLRMRLRAQENNSSTSNDMAYIEAEETSQFMIDLFAIVERRSFWGRPAPIIGNFKATASRGTGEIRGRVFVDLNDNYTFDMEDKPLAGVLVRLDDGFIVETDAQGLYRLPQIGLGLHDLILDQESFPIDYASPWPEGLSIQIYPRSIREVNWVMKPEN